MKAKLKYPIFSFAPKGNMIYVFQTEKLYTTTNTKLLKKRKNYIVVDATGTKFVETGAYKVKWQGIFGFCTKYQEECWDSTDEFRQAILNCKTFEEVADILMPKRKKSVWQRIEEYFLRIGFLILAAMLLYHVVWRLIQKVWLWTTG